MKQLAKFENEVGTVAVLKADGCQFTVLDSDVRREERYSSKMFYDYTEAIDVFWEIRDGLEIAEQDNEIDCKIVEIACSLTDEELKDFYKSFETLRGEPVKDMTLSYIAREIANIAIIDNDWSYYNHAKNKKGLEDEQR